MENNEFNTLDDIDNVEAGIENVEDSEDIKKGEEEVRESFGDEEKADAQEGQADASEGEEPQKEGEALAKEGEVLEKESEADSALNDASHTYSAAYNMPYCIPARVDAGRKGKGTVAAIIAACAVFALFLGVTCGIALSPLFLERDEDGAPAETEAEANDGETKTVLKNDSGSNVEEKVVVNENGEMSIVGVVEKVAASVVEVSTLTSSNYGQYVSSGAGSGVIISVSETHSYIITNYHVIEGSDSIKVRLIDDREFDAEYVDGDSSLDIAMLKIAVTENIVQAVIGSSQKLKVGQGVVAIGNPLGELGGTVTDGIISALDREITIDGVTMVLLQTNAAVNPGNSGGGLFNMAGELIGIVNAKKSDTGIEGLAFAIPIDYVYDEILEILNDGYIRGRLTFGFSVSYMSAQDAWRKFGTGQAGIYVVSSSDENIEVGDRITRINSTELTSAADVDKALVGIKAGDRVTFFVVRGGVESEIVITPKEYVPS